MDRCLFPNLSFLLPGFPGKLWHFGCHLEAIKTVLFSGDINVTKCTGEGLFQRFKLIFSFTIIVIISSHHWGQSSPFVEFIRTNTSNCFGDSVNQQFKSFCMKCKLPEGIAIECFQNADSWEMCLAYGIKPLYVWYMWKEHLKHPTAWFVEKYFKRQRCKKKIWKKHNLIIKQYQNWLSVPVNKNWFLFVVVRVTSQKRKWHDLPSHKPILFIGADNSS